MSAEWFHTRLRNTSAHMRNGNGREWKGMEGNGISLSGSSSWLGFRNARDKRRWG